MDPKIELFTKLCTAMDSPDAKAAVWEVLAGYTVAPTAATTSLADSVKQFLAAKRADSLSEKTLHNYQLILRLFEDYVALPPAQITTDHIRSFLTYLKTERSMKKESVQTYLNCIRSFFGWLHTEDKISKNPVSRIRSARRSKKHYRDPLTQEEVELVRAAIETPRERAIFEMLLSTGCRVSEIVDIRTADIDWHHRSLTVHGKGNKYRTVYFTVRAKLAMQSYLKTSPNPETLFTSQRAPFGALKAQSIEGIIRDLGQRSGIAAELVPHALRHTFATHALNSGMDIVVIQQLLGHESLDTTQIYAELSQEIVKHAYNQFVA